LNFPRDYDRLLTSIKTAKVMQTKAEDSSPKLGYESRAAVDPRCTPIKPKTILPEGDAIPRKQHTAEENETWKILYARQRERLAGRACREFMHGLEIMDFPEDRIPDLSDIHKKLKKTTNWGISLAPGLIAAEDFYASLARRVFPCTDYIRGREELDYTPAPDCFHDIFGHTTLITEPYFANFYQKFGQVAGRAQGQVHQWLASFYWFTVEFGLINTPEGIRIYGNGILSSFGEVEHCLGSEVKRLPFNPQQMAEQPADLSIMQPILFVIDSFEQLETEFDRWTKKLGL
jgi:phenylalanine-4-hydroxylase